jgi:hypothetical protein
MHVYTHCLVPVSIFGKGNDPLRFVSLRRKYL